MGNVIDDLDDGQAVGHFKGGVLGFAKSGKTYTNALLACHIRERFGLTGHIAMFDTEGGSTYVKHIVQELTGKQLLAKRARSFGELMGWGKKCVSAGEDVSVCIVDSITHPWRELCDSYLEQKYPNRNAPRLQFQDWAVLKLRWSKWTEFYLNSALHICLAGRAGYEYDWQADEDTGKKELVKTGTKMKTETEFGFEPSCLFEMHRVQGGDKRPSRMVNVLGDRFGVIDGRIGYFPALDDHKKEMDAVGDFFAPHLEMLVAGEHATIDTDSVTGFDMNDQGEERFQANKTKRQILLERIEGVLTQYYPSATGKGKARKIELCVSHFNTRSWKEICVMRIQDLAIGLENLEGELASAPVEGVQNEDPSS